MSWTNINTEEGEIQLLCCYIEPGDNEVTRGRLDKITSIVQDMIRQDRNARIILGGDINAQVNNLHERLTKMGFTPGLEEGTPTHRDGNMLDQVWVRNLQVTNVLLSE